MPIRARSTAAIARDVADYLDTHPLAQDTAEGIATWWVHDGARTVKLALDELVSAGVLEAHELAGTIVYGRPKVRA